MSGMVESLSRKNRFLHKDLTEAQAANEDLYAQLIKANGDKVGEGPRGGGLAVQWGGCEGEGFWGRGRERGGGTAGGLRTGIVVGGGGFETVFQVSAPVSPSAALCCNSIPALLVILSSCLW